MNANTVIRTAQIVLSASAAVTFATVAYAAVAMHDLERNSQELNEKIKSNRIAIKRRLDTLLGK